MYIASHGRISTCILGVYTCLQLSLSSDDEERSVPAAEQSITLFTGTIVPSLDRDVWSMLNVS